jgi:hypothetical protein
VVMLVMHEAIPIEHNIVPLLHSLIGLFNDSFEHGVLKCIDERHELWPHMAGHLPGRIVF